MRSTLGRQDPLWADCLRPIREIADEQVHVNIINTEREVFNAQLERMYDEEFGDTNETLEGMSVKDRKAEEIMDQSATLVNGIIKFDFHFERMFPTFQTVYGLQQED